MTATVTVAGYRASYPVVKRNKLTTLIVLDDGNVVKRHNRKHQVELQVHKGMTFEPVKVGRAPWYKRLWNWIRR